MARILQGSLIAGQYPGYAGWTLCVYICQSFVQDSKIELEGHEDRCIGEWMLASL